MPRETEIGRFFRRELNCQDIFTFWNAERAMWVLAYWLDPTHRVLDEIEDRGPNFEEVTRPFVEMIRHGWGTGINWGAHKKRLLNAQKRRIEEQNDQIFLDQERWNWVKRRNVSLGRNPTPYAVDVCVPKPSRVLGPII